VTYSWTTLLFQDPAPTGLSPRSLHDALPILAEDTEAGYRQGFGAGMDNLAGVAERTMVLQRVIRAPRDLVWGAWMNPETLPQWRSEEHTSELQSRENLVCRLLLEKKKITV